MEKNKRAYVYNLALRRDDGKIEQDTVFSDYLLTREDVRAIAAKVHCSVLVSCVGTYRPGNKRFIDDNSFVVELSAPKVVKDVNN